MPAINPVLLVSDGGGGILFKAKQNKLANIGQLVIFLIFNENYSLSFKCDT